MARKHGEFNSVREAILITAAELYTRSGVHGTSLNDIAVAAKMSKGTLYYYYPQKEQLTLEIAGISISRTTNALRSWVNTLSREDDPETALAALADTLTSDGHEMRLHTVLVSEASCDNEALSMLLRTAYHEWTVMFEVGALKLNLDSAVVHTRAQLFFMLLDGYMLEFPAGVTDMDRLELVKRVISG